MYQVANHTTNLLKKMENLELKISKFTKDRLALNR